MEGCREQGTFPFCNSLDTVGPLACSVEVLAAAYDAMQGLDPCDPVCQTLPCRSGQRANAFRHARAAHSLRSGLLRNACTAGGSGDSSNVLLLALGAQTTVDVPEAERAGAAALVITRAESGQLHLDNLRTRADDFDPLIRDRLLANTLIPASWYVQAQRFRRWHHRQLMKLFETVDVVLAPATPSPAHRIGEKEVTVRDMKLPARAAAGLLGRAVVFGGSAGPLRAGWNFE